MCKLVSGSLVLIDTQSQQVLSHQEYIHECNNDSDKYTFADGLEREFIRQGVNSKQYNKQQVYLSVMSPVNNKKHKLPTIIPEEDVDYLVFSLLK